MDSLRDTELRYSAVEQYIRGLPYLPDAWDFNGETLTVVSGGDITTIPYENTQTVMAAEDVGGLGGRDLTPEIEDNEDFRYFSQADEERDPLEEREDQQFFLSVSLVPKDYFVADRERVQQDVHEFLAAATHSGWRPEDHLIIAADSQNNEIDILIHTFGDPIPYEKMVQLHTLFTEVFADIDVSGYVYADFVEPLIETNYPFTYGYPAARQAMMGRAWESESFAAQDEEDFELKIKTTMDQKPQMNTTCMDCGTSNVKCYKLDLFGTQFWLCNSCGSALVEADILCNLSAEYVRGRRIPGSERSYPRRESMESQRHRARKKIIQRLFGRGTFAAEDGARWIDLDPAMVARWLSSPPANNPELTPPIWSEQEAQLLLQIMQKIEDGDGVPIWLFERYDSAQNLLAIAARDGPALVLDLQQETHIFDAETVVFEARPTTMQKIREKYVEIWEGSDYAEQDEDNVDYGLPHSIARTLSEIDEKSEIKEQSLEWICNQFAATDPTTNELWEPHLIWPEDLPRALDVWNWYAEEKKDPSIQNKFRELFPGRAPKNPLEYSIEDIEDVMDATTPEAEKSAKNERWNPQELGYDPKIAKEILNKDGLMVVEITQGPGAAQAASTYASGTRWCTSSPSTATYYLKQGPLYIVFQNGQKFAQIHAETNQVCDLRDRNMTTLPESLSQFMFDRNKKNYDEKLALTKNPKEVRTYLVQLQKDELLDRMAKENAKLKSLQTRFGDPADPTADPIRALIVKPYIDEAKMDEIKRTHNQLSEQLKSNPSDLVSDREVETWVNDQERTLGDILQSMIGFRESSEGVKPDDPDLRKRMYEVLETRGPEDNYSNTTYQAGETFGKALGYFMGDGKRNEKVEKILMNVKNNDVVNAVFDTAVEYYMNPQFANQWSNDDRWIELESVLDPQKSKHKLVKGIKKKSDYDHKWRDAIKNYLLVGGHQNNPSSSAWDNAEPDIWRWPQGFLLIMGDKHPAQGDRRRKINEILGVALDRYKKGHQEQMPEALAKKVIPNLAIPDVLKYAAIFPEHLTQGVQLPVVEKSDTIQDVAIELIEMVYGKDSSRDWRGNRQGAVNSNLDAWPDGEERIMEYIESGGELTPEIVAAFELVIEPKLDAKTRRIRESNTKGGMKPPAQKGYPCAQCLENLSWGPVKSKPGRLSKLLGKGKKNENAWVNAEGKTKCIPAHGWDQEEQDYHMLVIPSTLLVCDNCQGWRPVAQIRRDSITWQDNRIIQNAGPAEKKCKCTFRKDNVVLYEAEDRRNKCGNCGERGHMRKTCTNEPKEDPVDPRQVEDFEHLIPKESKMARGARVKRNIRRLLTKLGPLTRSGLVSAYQSQRGGRAKPRQEMRLITRMANVDSEVLEWRGRYYILGPGGKQEFFMRGPGSLGLGEKKSAEESSPTPFGEIDVAMADALARTHQRITEIGKAMDEILQKHDGSYEAAEVDPAYLKLASEYAHLSRAILRIQNVMRD